MTQVGDYLLFAHMSASGKKHRWNVLLKKFQLQCLPLLTSGCPPSESHSVTCNSLQPHGLYSPWYSPGQNTGVGSLSLLQGIIPTQGSNRDLLYWRWIIYQLSYQGSSYIHLYAYMHILWACICIYYGLPPWLSSQESARNAGDLSLIPGLARSPGEGKDYPLQYSVLENSRDCIIHGVAKSQTQLGDFQKTNQWYWLVFFCSVFVGFGMGWCWPQKLFEIISSFLIFLE